jgi:hypothetical protein
VRQDRLGKKKAQCLFKSLTSGEKQILLLPPFRVRRAENIRKFRPV